MEVGKRANQSKTKERAGDAKRIQDLERQVSQLRNIYCVCACIPDSGIPLMTHAIFLFPLSPR